MDPIKLKEHIEAQGKSFEALKEKNEELELQLKKSSGEGAELKIAIDKINADMDAKDALLVAEKARVDALEASIKTRGNGSAQGKESSVELQKYRELGLKYIKTGDKRFENELKNMEKTVPEVKALVSNNDPNGGYMVVGDTSGEMVTIARETSPMRTIANVETINAAYIEGPVDDGLFEGRWVGETQSRTDTDTASLGMWRITPKELEAAPKISQTMIEDSMDPEAYISRKTDEIIELLENTAFVSGNGSLEPQGFLSYGATTNPEDYKIGKIGQMTSAVSGSFNTDDLLELFYYLKTEYANNSAYAMNRTSIGVTRRLKDNDGQYLWQNSLTIGAPATFNGVPVVAMNDMPGVASGAVSVAIADWKRAYTIVDRRGMRLLVDPYTARPFVKYISTKRVGGDVTNFDAIKTLKCLA